MGSATWDWSTVPERAAMFDVDDDDPSEPRAAMFDVDDDDPSEPRSPLIGEEV